MRKNIIAPLAGVALLGACTPVDHGFGNSVRHNIALQVIDPDPTYAGTEIEGASGERAATAHRRYRLGQVPRPAVQSGRGGAGGTGGSSSGTSGSGGGTTGQR